MQARSLRPVTIDERLRVLRSLETYCGTPPDEASAAQIAEWLAAGTWSASTRATYHGYLKAWFDWLQAQDLRDDNPLLKIPAPRTPRRRPRPIDDQHMNRLLATRMHTKTRAMILLAALAGLRVHEIAKVKGEDVDLIAGVLHVIGKGGVVDELPLHPLLAEVAREMPRRGYWFPANARAAVPGTCVRSKSVSDIIAGVMRRAEVPGTPHSLRHWFGTTLVDSGVDLRTAQELLRHASLATTQIYTQVSSKRRVEGINRLDPWRAIAPADPTGAPV
ncbi:tyrosine-type recombinase/integrase [Rhodococcus sp. 14-2470-1a]|uniref:tyrosine-type recombinase/integrase n=1 Tax=Rhodococcus sp. 14-2470-1a TaxID=2023150 RepID=UPI0015C6808E|nr:tyrosine-type recombinase/integrase [Rhodococcus sp. 14-2470-1a]